MIPNPESQSIHCAGVDGASSAASLTASCDIPSLLPFRRGSRPPTREISTPADIAATARIGGTVRSHPGTTGRAPQVRLVTQRSRQLDVLGQSDSSQQADQSVHVIELPPAVSVPRGARVGV